MDDPSALAWEYQGDHGSAGGNLDVSDLVDNPAVKGICRVLGLRLAKETSDVSLAKVGVLCDDRPDSLLLPQEST